MTYLIYKLIDPRNNQLFYIGYTSKPESRPGWHSYSARKTNKVSFKNNKIKAIQTCGLEPLIINHKFFDNKQEALMEEMRLIEKYGRLINKSGILTNITTGGEGTSGVTKNTKGARNPMYGMKHSEEAKILISNKNKGRIPHPISNSQKEAIRLSNSTRVITEETRKKMSKAHKGINRNPNRPPMSKETRKLISESRKIYTKYSFYHPEYGNFFEDRYSISKKFPGVNFSRLINGFCKTSRGWCIL